MELLLNQKSLGKQPAGKENRYTAAFELTYEPGILEAVSYENGVVISRCSLSTTGAPHAIRLTSDCPDTLASLSSDGHSLAYISVEIVDKNGVTVPDAALPLSAAVTGVGMLLSLVWVCLPGSALRIQLPKKIIPPVPLPVTADVHLPSFVPVMNPVKSLYR